MDARVRGLTGKAKRSVQALLRQSQGRGPGRTASPPPETVPMPETYDATDAAAELMAKRRIVPFVVPGTGDNGRIQKADVERYIQQRGNS